LARKISDVNYPQVVNGVEVQRPQIPAYKHANEVLRAAGNLLHQQRTFNHSVKSYNQAHEKGKYLPMEEKGIVELWHSVPLKPQLPVPKEESKKDSEKEAFSTDNPYSDDYIAHAAQKQLGSGKVGSRPSIYPNDIFEEHYEGNVPQGDDRLKFNGAAGPTTNGTQQVKGTQVINNKARLGAPSGNLGIENEHSCGCDDFSSDGKSGAGAGPRPPPFGVRSNTLKSTEGAHEDSVCGSC
jgi:hypothetical protein